jgi:hypothetical protein
MEKRAAKKILEAMGFELRRVNYKFEPKKEDRFNGFPPNPSPIRS